MPNYQIVASDLDGTLLKDDMTVSEENLHAIDRLTQKGVQFVIATGRTLGEIDPAIYAIPSVRYIIHSDGAVVYDKQTGERLCACIPQALSNWIYDVLSEYEHFPSLRFEGKLYMDQAFRTFEAQSRCHVTSYFYGLFDKVGNYLSDFECFWRSRNEMEMINAFFRNDADLEACVKRLEAQGDLVIASSAEHSIEIFYKTAGKGNALWRLADALGIDRKQTIAVGDSTNDSSCVRQAGLGLAVSNACDALKELADEIICSNEEHAICYIAKRYFEMK